MMSLLSLTNGPAGNAFGETGQLGDNAMCFIVYSESP